MRKLAGAVAENNDCQKGATNPLGGEAIETPGATTASCSMDRRLHRHVHALRRATRPRSEQSGAETAKQYMDSRSSSSSRASAAPRVPDPEEGDWDGDGMAGTYYSIDLGYGNGMLVFQVNDSPVAGVLMHISTRPDRGCHELTDYFDQHVKPGGDGGA